MNPIVCWDFDETLGYFRPLEFAYTGAQAPEGMPPVRLKPGIRELLPSLPEFTHVVTTAAIGDYARGVLRDHGLLDLFAAVVGREEGIFTGDGKNYQVIGERFGIDEPDLRQRLAIVGNDPKRDPDSKYRQIVMVFDERMIEQPSLPIGVVLRRLLVEGQGGFKRGFDLLFERARRENSFNPSLMLEEGVTCGIDYWGSFAANKLHPMVINPRSSAKGFSL